MAKVTDNDNIEEIKKYIANKLKMLKGISHEKDDEIAATIIEGIYKRI